MACNSATPSCRRFHSRVGCGRSFRNQPGRRGCHKVHRTCNRQSYWLRSPRALRSRRSSPLSRWAFHNRDIPCSRGRRRNQRCCRRSLDIDRPRTSHRVRCRSDRTNRNSLGPSPYSRSDCHRTAGNNRRSNRIRALRQLRRLRHRHRLRQRRRPRRIRLRLRPKCRTSRHCRRRLLGPIARRRARQPHR